MTAIKQARQRARNLRDILLRERELLRRGQYQELADIEGLSERAMEDLLKVRQEVAKRIEHDILAIRTEAARNQDLFKAALRGVSAARAQMQQLATQCNGLGVYTSDGTRVDIPVRGTGRTHRY